MSNISTAALFARASLLESYADSAEETVGSLRLGIRAVERAAAHLSASAALTSAARTVVPFASYAADAEFLQLLGARDRIAASNADRSKRDDAVRAADDLRATGEKMRRIASRECLPGFDRPRLLASELRRISGDWTEQWAGVRGWPLVAAQDLAEVARRVGFHSAEWDAVVAGIQEADRDARRLLSELREAVAVAEDLATALRRRRFDAEHEAEEALERDRLDIG